MATKMKSGKTGRRAPSSAQQRMLDSMHQIWLAGLGAVSKARSGAPQLLDELVAEGARVHTDTRRAAGKALGGLVDDAKANIDSHVTQVRRQAADAVDNMEKIFQTRVQQALTHIGVPSAEDVDALGKRIEKLNASINKLAPGRKGNGRRPPHMATAFHSAVQ